MSLRSLTTCSYVSDATSFAMRHCTIVVTPLPMSPEPDSFRSREFIMYQHASGLGNEKKLPCRWWLIDGCKSLFNVKLSTVPTRLIHELYAKTLSPDKIACAPSPPAPRQCTPPQLAHSLHRTRMRPHSAIRIHTEHVPCELLAATHTHNTIHCT